MALGDKNGTIKMTDEGASSRFSNNGEDIILKRLDDYLKNTEDEIDLIKIDIEGSEQSLLQGAFETIKKFRPILAISIYHSPEDFFDIKPWLEKNYQELNYQFKIVKANPFSLTQEIMLIAY